MEFIRLFMPVIWALAGTIIGLALYRSSGAFFERTERKEGEVRRLRLVGSICIAAVVFLGIWEATPRELITGIPKDAKLIRIGDLRAVAEDLEQVNSAENSLRACASITPPKHCQAELDRVRIRINDSLGRVKELAK